MFIYLIGFFLLLFMGILMFMFGLFLFYMDMSYLLDWEIYNFNSINFVYTLLFDWMSCLFISFVMMISSMIIFYSSNYMKFDCNYFRFYYLVLLFVFSMIFMIVSPNLMSILLGWDGLGLVSYCLIIFFYNDKSSSAGMMTILMNRLGDLFILISFSWIINFGSWYFMFYFCFDYFFVLIIILAGFTKSAQIPFSSWLPVAMAAPTPVSALVHSSTLVTAGVYLLIRFYNGIPILLMSFFLWISLLTMIMSGLSANFEYDLKKIIALSTLNHLGMMMFILFLGEPYLCFFHLIIHAFFKSLMFLCAGVMIHSMNDNQDIRLMGGLVNQLPLTCTFFIISVFSICGFPFMSGFYSKDIIIEFMNMNNNNIFMFILFMVVMIFSFSYSFRMVYFCCVCSINMKVCNLYNENWFLSLPLFFLGFFSIFMGSFINWLFFNPIFIFVTFFLKLIPFFLLMVGFFLGLFYSIQFYYSNMYIYIFNYLFSFLGLMWFLPYFSTFMYYFMYKKISFLFMKCLDWGWGEFFISSLIIDFISFAVNFLISIIVGLNKWMMIFLVSLFMLF
uniref:NADH-ubiquinone oxidoreductase chain 5 n=1 Tax=Polytoxus fuscovittatus TaxID=1347745 RepID=A0A7I6HJN1_9HEMI|nr:NADH dehydrogenase subunit 5 [Polytoxus fuscovittatus]